MLSIQPPGGLGKKPLAAGPVQALRGWAPTSVMVKAKRLRRHSLVCGSSHLGLPSLGQGKCPDGWDSAGEGATGVWFGVGRTRVQILLRMG